MKRGSWQSEVKSECTSEETHVFCVRNIYGRRQFTCLKASSSERPRARQWKLKSAFVILNLRVEALSDVS